MSKDVSFGQYYPISSPIHSLNPCLKLIAYIVIIVFAFVIKNFYGFISLFLLLLITSIVSKVPIKSVLSSLKTVLFLILFTAVLNIFLASPRGENDVVLLKLKFITVTKGTLIFAAFLALRLVVIAIASGLLTLTTSPIELTDGIEMLLSPLKLLHLPIHTLALIMSIALRFIPTLTEKTQTIMSAQKARGSQLDSSNFLVKIKALIPVLIPLLIGAFNIADQLGDAMDARCYTGKGRTKYKTLSFKLRDCIAILLMVLFVVSVFILNHFFKGV